jgi:hypothetical protein
LRCCSPNQIRFSASNVAPLNPRSFVDRHHHPSETAAYSEATVALQEHPFHRAADDLRSIHEHLFYRSNNIPNDPNQNNDMLRALIASCSVSNKLNFSICAIHGASKTMEMPLPLSAAYIVVSYSHLIMQPLKLNSLLAAEQAQRFHR